MADDPPRPSAEMGGPDPIDSALAAGGIGTTTGRFRAVFQSRAALGLAPAAAPALLLVPLGFALGPAGFRVVSDDALAHLDMVVSLALAALGVFVGLGLDGRRGERRLLAAATVESLLTVLLVAAACTVLVSAWGMKLDAPSAVVALALGVVASASSAGAAEVWHDERHRVATRIADLDDVAPILIGGFVIAAAGTAEARTSLLLTAATLGVGAGAAVAGWLLFERASGEAERAVFVAGAVLLLAGSAAYLGASPLLAGLAAGTCWRLLPGQADRVVAEQLRKFQHPLVVVLLLVAGATVSPSVEGVWLLAPFLAFRLAGKVIGGWFASRLAPGLTPSYLGSYLFAPGVLGIAFALNFRQVSPSHAGEALLFAGAVGSLLGELIAMAAFPPARPA